MRIYVDRYVNSEEDGGGETKVGRVQFVETCLIVHSPLMVVVVDDDDDV